VKENEGGKGNRMVNGDLNVDVDANECGERR